MDRVKKGEEFFCSGYNCAQAVLLAYADLLELSEQEAIKVASTFGGGMGLGEACGTITGMCMVVGMYKGAGTIDFENKKELKKLIREMTDEFKKEYTSVNCREILMYRKNAPQEKKSCQSVVRTACEIIDKYMLGFNC